MQALLDHFPRAQAALLSKPAQNLQTSLSEGLDCGGCMPGAAQAAQPDQCIQISGSCCCCTHICTYICIRGYLSLLRLKPRNHMLLPANAAIPQVEQ